MPAPDKIRELVESFDSHIDELKSKDYKELSLCTDFLNPFFESLGWDVANSQQKAEKFRDVIQQYNLMVGGTTKAPDYLFKIGNTGVFFVEAKKPSVDIEKAKEPAFQLRRYGWNKKDIDISILADFENLSVYDCRIKPSADDNPRVGRIVMYSYKDYIAKWDDISAYFSRSNVEKGSLDKLLKEGTDKGNKESVDETFLKMIEEWRDILARNIALRNENLDVRQLNYTVQQTIDRIIFLRIAEDRGLEMPNQLQALTNYGNIYDSLKILYENADSRYNSGLFHFKSEKGINTQPDTISMSLSIDDKVLKDMISNLYYPKSPFDFAAMPADILGQVYERFLGKVIRLTDGHHAKVEEKPEVRKAGGVYYTPTYIVDYIVQNTVGKLVEGKTPEQVAKLKILDPACGSGSFLIGAYQYLLDWHLEWYQNNDLQKWLKGKNPPICEQMSQGQRIFKLTTEKRKEILKNNIYGVDIDRQAVEVSKLNLLLKVLEQENNPDLFKHNQRALPDLGGNIKCGNSLIGMDFYNGKEDLFNNPEETWRVNAFDWDREFPQIIRYKKSSSILPPPGEGVSISSFARDNGRRCPEGTDEGVYSSSVNNTAPIKDKNNKTPSPQPSPINMGEGVSGRQLEDGFGFDAVIGNPPYGAELSLTIKEYAKSKYSYVSDYESSQYFIKLALTIISKQGIFGMIVPNTLFLNLYAKNFRESILRNNKILSFANLAKVDVFQDATVRTCIPIIKGEEINSNSIEFRFFNDEFRFLSSKSILQNDLIDCDALWSTSTSHSNCTFMDKINIVSTSLNSLLEVSQGLIPYDKYRGHDEYTIKNRIWHAKFKKDETYRHELKGGDVTRYFVKWNGENWISYGEWLAAPRKKTYFTSPRLLFREITDPTIGKINVGYTGEESYNNPSIINCIKRVNNYSLLYILGISNSSLISYYHFLNSPKANKGIFPKILVNDVRNLPIRTIDFANKADVAMHDRMVSLVETMLELNKRLRGCSVPGDVEMIKRQIESTDNQIDQLVYKLYGLTDDEIRIVQDSFAENRKK